jgi:predicted O-methyltransferase YrrM
MISQEIEDYILAHTSDVEPLLQELYRETHLKVMHPRMLSGPLQGVFLQLISRMVCPRVILEIGTYTGYSALCLLKGLHPEGKLHTIEVNEELIVFARRYFEKAQVDQLVVQHQGEALKIIPRLDMEFDLVFIDADKENYLNYYQLIIEKLRPGGVILVDNTLWDGKVLNPKTTDKETRGIIEFNEFVQQDNRVTNLLLPLRDGIMVLLKNQI